MAVEELVLGVTEQDGPLPPLEVLVTHQKLGRLGPGSGTVYAGTPLVRIASGRYDKWQYGQEIFGFLLVSVVLDSVKDTFGDIMLHGEIGYDDVVLPTGQLQADLDAALRRLREAGIRVSGLTDTDAAAPDSTLNSVVPNFLGPTAVVYNPAITQV